MLSLISMQLSSRRELIKTLNPPTLLQTSVFLIAKFLINSIAPFLKNSSLSLDIDKTACIKIEGNEFSLYLSQAFINLKH